MPSQGDHLGVQHFETSSRSRSSLLLVTTKQRRQTLVFARGFCLSAVAIFFLGLASPALSQSLSFSTDFDGKGTGGSISVSTFTPSGHGSSSQYYTYELQRYEEQRREAERAAALQREIATRAQNGIDALDLLDKLYRLYGAEPQSRSRLTKKVIEELEPDFRRKQQEALNGQNAILQRLTNQMDHIKVPVPPLPPHYRSIFIGGLSYTPEDAAKDKNNKITNPYSRRPFDDEFGFASKSFVLDLGRVVMDHLLLDVNRLTEHFLDDSANQLRRLKGSTIEELVCHSNGCTLARALIQSGFIRSVGRLRMLGGDSAVTNLDSLREFQRRTGTVVSVVVVIGDQVPLLPVGWQIMDAIRKIGGPLLQSFKSSESLTYEVLGLKARGGFRADAPIRVEFFSAPVSDEPWTYKHHRDTYFGIVSAQTIMGARRENGDLNPAAVIQSTPEH